jgi:hypothetical protein
MGKRSSMRKKISIDVMLNASDNDFIEKLGIALGIEKGDTLNIVTPQFKRTDGRIITYFPDTVQEYEALKNLDESTLEKIGCQRWDIKNNEIHWLYPSQWHAYIPNGLIVVNLMGKEAIFKKEKSDDDERFGALPYGFLKLKETAL